MDKGGQGLKVLIPLIVDYASIIYLLFVDLKGPMKIIPQISLENY